MNEQICIMQTSMMRMALLTESETNVLVLFWIISSCLPPSLTLSQTLSFSLPLSPSLCPLSVHPLRAALSLFHSLRYSGSSLAIPSSLALSPVTCSSPPREKHCHSFGPHSLASYSLSLSLSLPVSLCFDGPARRVFIVREIRPRPRPRPRPLHLSSSALSPLLSRSRASSARAHLAPSPPPSLRDGVRACIACMLSLCALALGLFKTDAVC